MNPPKNSHDIAKVTHISGRSANISTTRLDIEALMKGTGQAYSSKMLADAVGTTPHNASRILREMRKAGTARSAGTEPKHGKPMRRHHTAAAPATPPARPAPQRAPGAEQAAQQVAGPRIHTNAATPNGSPEYWARMLAWGRST